MVAEDKTRQYSVYITDKNNSVHGSGVLYYPGGQTLFVFTCAHVLDDVDPVRVFILKPIDIDTDQYTVFRADISKTLVYYSPLDEVTGDGDIRNHSEDFVIIEIKKPDGFDIEPTDYYVGESSRNTPIYTQGYPGGVPADSNPIEYLECFHGSIVVNIADNRSSNWGVSICLTPESIP